MGMIFFAVVLDITMTTILIFVYKSVMCKIIEIITISLKKMESCLANHKYIGNEKLTKCVFIGK